MSVGVRSVQGPQQGKGKGWSLVLTGSPESPEVPNAGLPGFVFYSEKDVRVGVFASQRHK